MIDIKLKVLPGAKTPEYHSGGAAGADIYAFLEKDVIIRPGGTALIPAGFSMQIPDGYEAQIRPRSGLALNHGITLLNSPGTIDSDYRGEIKVIVTNLGTEDFTVTNHMRIAQMVLSRIYRANFEQINELNDTERGSRGFGHTGL